MLLIDFEKILTNNSGFHKISERKCSDFLFLLRFHQNCFDAVSTNGLTCVFLFIPATPDSDDLSVDELINRSRDDKDEIVHIKKKPAVSPHKLPRVHPRRTGVRRIRCKRCKGCQSTDCGTCTNCL